MPRFKQRPDVVEAFCWEYEEVPDWFTAAVEAERAVVSNGEVVIYTNRDNPVVAHAGDYIVRVRVPGDGEYLFPCRSKWFDALFEELPEADPPLKVGDQVFWMQMPHQGRRARRRTGTLLKIFGQVCEVMCTNGRVKPQIIDSGKLSRVEETK